MSASTAAAGARLKKPSWKDPAAPGGSAAGPGLRGGGHLAGRQRGPDHRGLRRPGGDRRGREADAGQREPGQGPARRRWSSTTSRRRPACPRAWLPSSGSARTSWCPGKAWAAWTRWTGSPWPSPSRRPCPRRPWPVPGWTSGWRCPMPGTDSASRSCCCPAPKLPRSPPGSTALGSSRSPRSLMVLVADEPDAGTPWRAGQQGQDFRRVEPGRRHASEYPGGDCRPGPGRPGRAAWSGFTVPSPSSGGARELAELLAACQSGLARAAVVAEGSEELTASLVDRLGAVGVAIIALTDNAEEAARLRGIGVASAADRCESAALAGRIAEAVAQLAGTASGSTAGDSAGCGHGCGTAPGPPPSRRTRRQAVRRRQDHCRVGTGRLARPDPRGGQHRGRAGCRRKVRPAGRRGQLRGQRRGRLGLLDEAAGLAQACRLADQGLLDAEALLRVATPVATKPGTFRVLTGITRADRWTELRAAALVAGSGTGQGDRRRRRRGHRLLPRSRRGTEL